MVEPVYDPRVFYAVERTLLAWVRTEIAIMAFLLATNKLLLTDASPLKRLFNTFSIVVAAFITLLSLLAILHAYRGVKHLGPNEIPSSYWGVAIIVSGAMGTLICLGSLVALIEL